MSELVLKTDNAKEYAQMILRLLAYRGYEPLSKNTAIPSGDVLTEEQIRRQLKSARLIFAGGRGLHTKETFRMLQDLAARFGAEVAVTRPLVLEGFAEEARMVGITGVPVKPDVLFAAGISGAIQFMGGAKESRCIIAVNSNRNSQIFRYAQHAFCADAESVLREMLALTDN